MPSNTDLSKFGSDSTAALAAIDTLTSFVETYGETVPGLTPYVGGVKLLENAISGAAALFAAQAK